MACEDCDHEHNEKEIRMKVAIESIHIARDQAMRTGGDQFSYELATEIFNFIMSKVEENE